LYFGTVRYKGEKMMADYSFFKKDDFGNIIPKNTQKLYDDELPTGVKIKRSEYAIFSNFKIEGERYKNLNRPLSIPTAQTKVAPNPVNGNILRGETTLFTGTQSISLDYQIIDVNGRVLSQSKNAITNRVFEIDIATLPTGVYLLRLSQGSMVQSTKFVKQ
jgi:hypothetical protein